MGSYPIEKYGQAAMVDVETTGLDATEHEILELAVILFTFQRSTGQIIRIKDGYAGLREPSGEIPRRASTIHGIHEDMVKNQSLDDYKIINLIDQAEFIVAHNAPFDYSFVTRLYPSAMQKSWLCSMSQIDWKGYGFHSKGLQNLLKAHKLNAGTAHRGKYDCEATLLLLNSRNPRGEHYFKELLLCLSSPYKAKPCSAVL